MNSYFKYLSRNKLFTIIEILGLSIALAFVIIILRYGIQENSVTDDIPDADKIYVFGSEGNLGMTYNSAPAIAERIPEINEWTRMYPTEEEQVFYGEKYLSVDVYGIDTNFYDFMGFLKMVEGDFTCINDPTTILVSKSFANKISEGKSVIGETISYAQDKFPLTIGGVFEDFKEKSIFEKADLLININHPQIHAEGRIGNYMDQFGSTNCFIKLHSGVNTEAFKEKLHKTYKELWDFWDDGFIKGVELVSLNKVYFCELDGNFKQGSKRSVNILFIVAAVLLLSAVFNYVNLSVAQTGARAKEMATRQLLGSTHSAILWRYIGESMLFTFGCFIVGYILSEALIPFVESALETQITIPFGGILAASYLALITFVGVISGLFPAIAVIKFKPIDVVKGTFKFRSKMTFSKVLIVVQCVISIVFIVVAMTLTMQMKYMVNMPKGVNQKDILTIIMPFRNGNPNSAMQDYLESLPFVTRVGRALGDPYYGTGGQFVTHPDGTSSILRASRMDSTAFKIFGFKIEESFGDVTSGVVFYTRTAYNRCNMEGFNPTKPFDNYPYPVGGIICDYVQGTALDYNTSEYNVVQIVKPKEYVQHFIVETTGPHDENLKTISEGIDKIFAEATSLPLHLEAQYLDDFMYQSLAKPRNTLRLISLFMLVSLLISALGMFAMCTYFTNQNAKTIAIRKIMGGSIKEIVKKYMKLFLIMTAAASLIATPIAYYAAQRYLSSYPYRMEIALWIFVFAIAAAFVITFASIFGQILHAAKANPVKYIKSE